MTLNYLKHLLLGMAGATEEYPFGPEVMVFKARKMFALVSWQDQPLRITLKCDPAEALALRDEYEAIQPGYHMNKAQWNTITLDGTISHQLLTDMIAASHELVLNGLSKKERTLLLQETTPRPTLAQYAWQDLERGMFCHFGLNTFHDQEWGEGKDSPESFDPKMLDAHSWVQLAKEAGLRYFVLTAKHHDGFCLWPTRTTDYSVRSSPWRGGQGDVVRDCAEACRALGMPLGLYLSPWDRHEPCYADPKAYNDFYCAQLTELLTQYGPLVEVWFDGAGSEGRVYDWPRIIGLVKRYQPAAMIFNMGAPTIRWVGNEDGVAPYPCWNAASEARTSMYTSDMQTWLPETPTWVPAECDVPIRHPHWFWHPEDEASLLSLPKLLDIYERSVGHGANLLLNVAPDNRGLVPDVDAIRMRELGAAILQRFSLPLAETQGAGSEIILELSAPTLVSHVVLEEEILIGERVREYVLEAEQADGWMILTQGSAIGHKKIDRFTPVETGRLRLRILQENGAVLLRRFAAFYFAEPAAN